MNIKSLIDSSYLARYLFLNAVDISDYNVFPSREIWNSPPVFRFLPSRDDSVPQPILDQVAASVAKPSQVQTLDQLLEGYGTTAFLVIKGDQLIFERYYNGYERSSICASFSTVKSFVSALIGIALQEKLIDDLDDPLPKYLPQLSASHWSAITIRHLVSMSSGLGYNEHGFLPWNDQPRIYYTTDIRQLAVRAKRVEPPGERFHYNNYNLVLLGMVLERVTGGSVSNYLQDKLWKPLGMEFPASWSLDSQHCGMEKMESGLNARAIDFAKFARLYLRRGDWQGRQIVPESWVIQSTTVDEDAKWSNYKYLWWIPRQGKNRFMAIGNLGQFIYVAPDRDCLVLRFGRGKPRNWAPLYLQLFASLVEQL